MAQISEKEAKTSIDKVVAALRKDKTANAELGRLDQIQNVLGFGSPSPNSVAVRFNASFRKGGKERGTMVGQVKAAVDSKTGKITSCSVFRDLGYGRSFNLKV